MSKSYLYFIIALLLVFNTLFLLKSRNNNSNSTLTFSSLYSPSTKILLDKKPKDFLNDEIYKTIENGLARFYVLTIIQENGCVSCIGQEIELIDSISTELNDRLIVIYAGRNEGLLKNSGLQKEYLFYNSLDEVFNEPLVLSSLNPISLVLDKNFIYNVREVDLAKPKSEYLTESYYSYILSLSKH